MSHVGWGMNPTARYEALAMYDQRDTNGTELRAVAGNFLFSTGANEFAGRYTAGHFDMPVMRTTIDGRRRRGGEGRRAAGRVRVARPRVRASACEARYRPAQRGLQLIPTPLRSAPQDGCFRAPAVGQTEMPEQLHQRVSRSRDTLDVEAFVIQKARAGAHADAAVAMLRSITPARGSARCRARRRDSGWRNRECRRRPSR